MLYGTLLGYIAGILFVVVKMKLYQYIEIGNISKKEFKPLIPKLYLLFTPGLLALLPAMGANPGMLVRNSGFEPLAPCL